jgi:hypothetical protein
MKVLLRREQRPGLLSGMPVLSLTVRAQISDNESENIRKYQLGKVELYTNLLYRPQVETFKGFANRPHGPGQATTLTVNDLWQANGSDERHTGHLAKCVRANSLRKLLKLSGHTLSISYLHPYRCTVIFNLSPHLLATLVFYYWE